MRVTQVGADSGLRCQPSWAAHQRHNCLTRTHEQHRSHVVQPGRDKCGGNPAGARGHAYAHQANLEALITGLAVTPGSLHLLPLQAWPTHAGAQLWEGMARHGCVGAASHEQRAEEAHAAAAALDRPGRHQLKHALCSERSRQWVMTLLGTGCVHYLLAGMQLGARGQAVRGARSNPNCAITASLSPCP